MCAQYKSKYLQKGTQSTINTECTCFMLILLLSSSLGPWACSIAEWIFVQHTHNSKKGLKWLGKRLEKYFSLLKEEPLVTLSIQIL